MSLPDVTASVRGRVTFAANLCLAQDQTDLWPTPQTESGSPLTCDDPGRPGRTVLVGLLSWNAACRGLLSWPDVYTRMADVDTFCWLERTVTTMLGEKQPYFGEKLCV